MIGLSEQSLKSMVPAAFAETHPMSSRYAQFRTTDALAIAADNGYYPVDAAQPKAKKRNPEFVKHMIVLRHESVIADGGDTVPQVLLYNSHNGRTTFRMHVGLYRFVCSNGLVAGEDLYAFALRHNLDAAKQVGDFLSGIIGHANDLSNVIDVWSRKQLTEGQSVGFARRAAELRWGERGGTYEPRALLEARRDDDDGNSLWQVFNRVQEATVKGGVNGVSSNKARAVKSRPLTEIQSNIEYNRQLWNTAAALAA